MKLGITHVERISNLNHERKERDISGEMMALKQIKFKLLEMPSNIKYFLSLHIQNILNISF